MPLTPLAITDLEFWPVQQPRDRRSYVLIRLSTDGALSGWGEVAAVTNLGAVVRRLEACRRELMGQDALGLEQLRQRLHVPPDAADRQGAAVLAALNMAQIDLLGKQSRARAAEILGGPTRAKARALAPLAGDSDADLLESLAQAWQAGFRAVSVPLNLPAGPARGRGFFVRTRQLLDQMREASRSQVDFVLDCRGGTTPAEAAALASAMEGFHLLWLDEPIARIQHQALSVLASESVTPIGWGRDATANSEFQDLLRQDAVDVLRPDMATFGITLTRKAAAMAETYYVAVAPVHRGGPVGSAAALQVAAAIPNFFIQEVPFPAHADDRAMRRELAGDLESPRDGYFQLPEAPGLGVSVNEDALEKYRIRP
jgi:galactonate dehydratase